MRFTTWTLAPLSTSSPVVTSPQSQQGNLIKGSTPRLPRIGGIEVFSLVPAEQLLPVVFAQRAADLFLKQVFLSERIHTLSASTAKQVRIEELSCSHSLPPLHSLKNSQELHCNPAEATQSSLCTPSTKLSICLNNRSCSRDVI